MTPEQENILFQTLGRVEEKIDNLGATLIEHTQQDSLNFAKMNEDLEEIKLDKAKASGVAEEAARHASSAGGAAGGKVGAFVSVIVSGIIAGVVNYFGK